MVIDSAQFNASVKSLSRAFVTTVQFHFQSMGIRMERDEILKIIGSDLDKIITDMHFYGAEIFPSETERKWDAA